MNKQAEALLPDGWLPLNGAAAAQALKSLNAELSPGHALFGGTLNAVARRRDCDDFLFQYNDGSVAEVHLTYSSSQDLRWPQSETYSSLHAWRLLQPKDPL